jgi:Na+-driven multidrug efflux pump
VIAQLGMAGAFAAVQRWVRPDPARIRRLIRVGGEIAVRTTALLAVFLVCSAVLARVSAASLGAHQIGYQLFLFIALVLDAVAIAGQVMVGRMLGASDADGAYAASRRMIGWSVALGVVFAAGLLMLAGVLPGVFTDDPAVVGRAEAMWPLLVAMMPFNGAVFALDGILIGAGDTRFIAQAMVLAGAVGVGGAIAASAAGWGIAGVWGALCAFIGVRLVTCLVRFESRRWARVGV